MRTIPWVAASPSTLRLQHTRSALNRGRVPVAAADDQPATAAPEAATAPPEPLRRPMVLIRGTEDLMNYLVIAALLVLAGMALYKTGADLFGHDVTLANRASNGLNGVLFAVIVLELMTTVLAHFQHAGLQPEPFLIIGIIAAGRPFATVQA